MAHSSHARRPPRRRPAPSQLVQLPVFTRSDDDRIVVADRAEGNRSVADASLPTRHAEQSDASVGPAPQRAAALEAECQTPALRASELAAGSAATPADTRCASAPAPPSAPAQSPEATFGSASPPEDPHPPPAASARASPLSEALTGIAQSPSTAVLRAPRAPFPSTAPAPIPSAAGCVSSSPPAAMAATPTTLPACASLLTLLPLTGAVVPPCGEPGAFQPAIDDLTTGAPASDATPAVVNSAARSETGADASVSAVASIGASAVALASAARGPVGGTAATEATNVPRSSVERERPAPECPSDAMTAVLNSAATAQAMGRAMVSVQVEEMSVLVRKECRLKYETELDEELECERRRWRAELNASEAQLRQAEERSRNVDGNLQRELISASARAEEAGAALQAARCQGEELQQQLDKQETLTRCVADELRACGTSARAQESWQDHVVAEFASKLSAAQEELAASKSAATESSRDAAKTILFHEREAETAEVEAKRSSEAAAASVLRHRQAEAAAGERVLGFEETEDRLGLVARRVQFQLREESVEAEEALSARKALSSEIADLVKERDKLLRSLSLEAASLARCSEVESRERERREDADAAETKAHQEQIVLRSELQSARAACVKAAEEATASAAERARDLSLFSAELRRCREEGSSLQRALDLARLQEAIAQGVAPDLSDHVGLEFAEIGKAAVLVQDMPPPAAFSRVLDAPGSRDGTATDPTASGKLGVAANRLDEQPEDDPFEAIGVGDWFAPSLHASSIREATDPPAAAAVDA